MNYQKSKLLTIHFFELSSIDKKSSEPIKSCDIHIKYFESLHVVLEKFNTTYNKNITELFNQFGQQIPLTYRIQKTGLHLYY